jgi:hypothetical protein
MTEHDLHYLRSILRQLQLTRIQWPSLGGEA